MNRNICYLKHVGFIVLGACVWWASSSGVMALDTKFKCISNVDYEKVDAKSLSLDIYVDPNATSLKPLVIYIHGGGWSARNKSDGGWYADAFLKKGYVYASVDYRLSTEAIFPAQIQDVKAAVRFLRAHAADYHIDPAHIGVMGHSAGGHLASLLGTTNGDVEFDVGENLNVSDAVQAVCDMSGPVDLNAPAPALTGMLAKLLGAPVSANPDLAKRASPINHISGTSAPFLILYGEKDPVIPPAESQSFATALQTAGVPVQLIVLPGQPHNLNLWAHKDHGNYLDTILDFFDSKLKGKT